MSSNDPAGATTSPLDASTRIVFPAGLICFALLAFRIAGSFSFRKPFLQVTSGCEEEVLFSLWKVMVKEPLFTDGSALPYALSYYNWLFYLFYGLPLRWLRAVVSWDPSWLPSIARWTTFGFTAGSAGLAGLIASRRGWWPTGWGTPAKAAFCVLAAANPVTGFFAFTARPDMGALFFELLGFLWVGAGLAERRQGLLYTGILALYLAWSFKQNTVSVICGVCLFLLLERRWDEFFRVAAVFLLLTVGTLYAGGSLYRYSVISQGEFPFIWKNIGSLFFRACAQSPLLPCCILTLPIILSPRGYGRLDEPSRIAALTFGCSLLWYGLLSAKEGAATNYFITPLCFGLLAVLALLKPLPSTGWQRLCGGALPIGLALQIAVCALVFSGRSGAVDLWSRNKPIEELQAALAKLPAPALCTVGCGNLPWVQTKPPLFVYPPAYFHGRSQGKKFVDGGLESMIASGYFKTIVQEETQREFHGQPLVGYEEVGRISGYARGTGFILYQYRGTKPQL